MRLDFKTQPFQICAVNVIADAVFMSNAFYILSDRGIEVKLV